MRIDYFEKDGELWFSCEQKVFNESGGCRTFSSSGKVPLQKVREGSEAIRLYVGQKVRREVQRQKREASAIDQHRRSSSFPIEVQYRGVLLKGKMSSSDGRFLQVVLEEPYLVHTGITYGWASAMAGRFIFDQNDPRKFSAHTIAAAKGLLVEAYQEEEYRRAHQDIIALADELNNGRKVRPPFYLEERRE